MNWSKVFRWIWTHREQIEDAAEKGASVVKGTKETVNAIKELKPKKR
jgi:hypothetical protein